MTNSGCKEFAKKEIPEKVIEIEWMNWVQAFVTPSSIAVFTHPEQNRSLLKMTFSARSFRSLKAEGETTQMTTQIISEKILELPQAKSSHE